MELIIFLKQTIYKDLELADIEIRIDAAKQADIERKKFCNKVEQIRLQRENEAKKEKDFKKQKVKK